MDILQYAAWALVGFLGITAVWCLFSEDKSPTKSQLKIDLDEEADQKKWLESGIGAVLALFLIEKNH